MIFDVVSNFTKRVGGRTFAKTYVEAPDVETAKLMAQAALVGYPIMFQTTRVRPGGIAQGVYLLTQEILRDTPAYANAYREMGGVL